MQPWKTSSFFCNNCFRLRFGYISHFLRWCHWIMNLNIIDISSIQLNHTINQCMWGLGVPSSCLTIAFPLTFRFKAVSQLNFGVDAMFGQGKTVVHGEILHHSENNSFAARFDQSQKKVELRVHPQTQVFYCIETLFSNVIQSNL